MMTREEAHTLLEVMAIELTGELANSERLVTERTKLLGKQLKAIDMAIEALSERPHGKWIFSTSIPIGGGRESAGYKCSVCGGNFFRVDGMDFCPNCGADMRGEKK